MTNLAMDSSSAAISIGALSRPLRERSLPSPKQLRSDSVGRSSWYPYYAGYSATFVSQVLQLASAQPGTSVLDPWNGAGTTTQVATDMGFRAFGFDLNPVMTLVARARLVSHSDVLRIRGVLDRLKSTQTAISAGRSPDPLSEWLMPKTVRIIRAFQRTIHELCGVSTSLGPSTNRAASFMYVCLFRVMRAALRAQRSKNPTWLKRPKRSSERPSMTERQLREMIAAQAELMLTSLTADTFWHRSAPISNAVLGTSPASDIPLPSDSVDCVIGSPPYCTRIDYAMSTAVELALLGIGSQAGLRLLRDEMTGTSTVRTLIPPGRDEWGPTCSTLLRSIDTHASKASRSYYIKTHLQYFADIYAAILEIERCLRPGGGCILVVQDSYYKNVHNDLPQILVEMGCGLGWELTSKTDFPITRTMVGVNRHAKLHLPQRTPIESVLWFRK